MVKTQYEINREMLVDLMETAESMAPEAQEARKQARERQAALTQMKEEEVTQTTLSP